MSTLKVAVGGIEIELDQDGLDISHLEAVAGRLLLVASQYREAKQQIGFGGQLVERRPAPTSYPSTLGWDTPEVR